MEVNSRKCVGFAQAELVAKRVCQERFARSTGRNLDDTLHMALWLSRFWSVKVRDLVETVRTQQNLTSESIRHKTAMAALCGQGLVLPLVFIASHTRMLLAVQRMQRTRFSSRQGKDMRIRCRRCWASLNLDDQTVWLDGE